MKRKMKTVTLPRELIFSPDLRKTDVIMFCIIRRINRDGRYVIKNSELVERFRKMSGRPLNTGQIAASLRSLSLKNLIERERMGRDGGERGRTIRVIGI